MSCSSGTAPYGPPQAWPRASICAYTWSAAIMVPPPQPKSPAPWSPHRSGLAGRHSSSPVPFPPRASQADGLSELRERILNDLAHPWTVTEMASLARMSERSFARRFVQTTGDTPLQWLLTQRVLAAQHLLDVSDLPITAIASRCGFGTPLTMRHHFTRHVGLPPRDYRQAFGTTTNHADAGPQV